MASAMLDVPSKEKIELWRANATPVEIVDKFHQAVTIIAILTDFKTDVVSTSNKCDDLLIEVMAK